MAVKKKKTKKVEKKIVPAVQGIVMPVVSPEEAVKAWKGYEVLKKKIIKPEDTQLIEGKKFLKKSYWRKLATFFNITTEIIDEKKEKLGKTFVWHFTIKATAPNGRSAVGVGSCDAFEKYKLVDGEYKYYNKYNKKWEEAKPNSIHNIRSTAETRATNRAISNLVGGGEVSAEEVNSGAINVDEIDEELSNEVFE
jgi:hypothetical protein